jgi:hypothetical protein
MKHEHREHRPPADHADMQVYTGSLLGITFCAAMCLVHFDAVRLRALRRAGFQITLGGILVLNNLRILVRERAQGARGLHHEPRDDAMTPAVSRYSTASLCISGGYCVQYRTIVSPRAWPTLARLALSDRRRRGTGQALSSLTNMTFFFARFVAARLYRDTAQTRLPVVIRRLPNSRMVELLAVVPHGLVPAGIGVQRGLQEVSSMADLPPLLPLRAIGHASAGAQGRLSASPSLESGAWAPNVELVAQPATNPRRSDTVESAELESRESQSMFTFRLKELQPDVVSTAVLVPLTCWTPEYLMSWPPLLRLRRTAYYQAASLSIMGALAATVVTTLWYDIDHPAALAVSIAALAFVQIVEFTRYERRLILAVVCAARRA